MIIDNTIQGAAAALLFAGLWLTGNKRLSGPALAAVAEIFTFMIGIWHETWSIILIGAVLFVVQSRNFVVWFREGVRW